MNTFLITLIIIIVILIPILLIFDKLMYSTFNSNLKVLGLDILKTNQINFVLSPHNHIYLMIFSRIYNNEPCNRSKALAQLINARLEVHGHYLHWYVNNKLIHQSFHNDYILLMPCGDLIEYEKRDCFTVDGGTIKLDGLLKSADDNQFELRNIDQSRSAIYKIIDTCDWREFEQNKPRGDRDESLPHK